MSILQVKDKDGNWVSIPSLQGPAGPNEITADTATPFDGLLKGDGSTVSVAVEGEDYAAAQHAPTHATDGTDPVTPGMIGALEYADLSGREASGTMPSFDGVFEGTGMDSVMLYGKSTQDGTPSPEAPVDIVSYEPKSLGVYGKSSIYDGPVTLHGIPVDSGGNYTDETGQQYIADTYDVVTGEYVQRVGRYVITGAESASSWVWNTDSLNTTGFGLRLYSANKNLAPSSTNIRIKTPAICTHGTTGNANDVFNGRAWCSASASTLATQGRWYFSFDPSGIADDSDGMIAYFAAQYAAGTPVTVDYALAEPIVTYLASQQIPAGPVMLYGKSVQNGTPSPENPIEITSYAGIGRTYPLTLTLPGIPVDEGGNYTDETGQQYIADTYDVVTGEYVQRVERYVITGAESASSWVWNTDSLNTTGFGLRLYSANKNLAPSSTNIRIKTPAICTHGTTGNANDVFNGRAWCSASASTLATQGRWYFSFDPSGIADDSDGMIAYFAAQYAAGTPVTILYALADPIVTYLDPVQIPAYAPVTNISAGGGYISAKLGQAMAPVQTTPQTLTAQQKKQVYINLDIPAPTYTYGGKDLSQYMTPAELGSKIDAGDYSGICMGDYWPVTLNGTYHDFADDVDVTLADELVKLEFMPYVYGPYGDVQTPNHILVCSRDCLSKTMKMRSANDVWYDETATNPMLGSHLYQTLNAANGIIALVEQTELGPYIYAGPNGKGMRFVQEVKAADATTATGWVSNDRGKLFLPTEREVWGQDIWSEHTYGGGGNALQWPIFAGSRRHIIKGLGNGGSRHYWWSASSFAGSAVNFCVVHYNGSAYYNASQSFGVPLCFLLTGPSAQAAAATATAAETTTEPEAL